MRPRSSIPFSLVLLPLTALALTAVVTPLGAQDRSVSWTEVSRIEMPGTLGAFLRATGALNERRASHALHVSGRTFRQDDGDSSTILDLDGRRWIAVDHEAKTYTVVTFEESAEMAREMAEVLQEARAGADEAMQEARAERDEAMSELRRSMDEAAASMDVRLRAEATGERRRFGDLNAERHLLIAEVEAREVEGLEASEGGMLVFLMELWQTPDFPSTDDLHEAWAAELAADPAMQELARELATAFEPVSEDLGPEALAAWDPRIAAGLRQLGETMASIEGTTVRSVTNVAIVEPGAQLDREALMAWEPESMGDRLRTGAGEAARDAGREAARGALRGMTRGMLGRGGGEPEAPAAEPPAVRPLLRATSEKSDVSVSRVEGSTLLREVLGEGGYREVPLPRIGELPRDG